ncbi:helix-turn-helix domain-containing protein [Rhizobium sp. HT1-10]|uniref:helix-turn-helix domain-containing protein n=1 Tax=Rhizobium sp. HT1-10 TaxID=3111638 RepID=UPI003C245495
MRPPTKLLIAARQMLELTQASLAKETGMHARTVYKLETGNGNIESVETLVTYFEGRGITFAPLEGEPGWTIINRDAVGSFDDERKRNRENRSQHATKGRWEEK